MRVGHDTVASGCSMAAAVFLRENFSTRELRGWSLSRVSKPRGQNEQATHQRKRSERSHADHHRLVNFLDHERSERVDRCTSFELRETGEVPSNIREFTSISRNDDFNFRFRRRLNGKYRTFFIFVLALKNSRGLFRARNCHSWMEILSWNNSCLVIDRNELNS